MLQGGAMELNEPLTEQQADRLNKLFGLNRKEQMRIRDFPVLHRMLTNLFHATYESTLVGKSVKLGFMGPELVNPEIHGKTLDHLFWEEKIGSYRIASARTYYDCSFIQLKPKIKGDIFLPDSFYLITAIGHFIVTINSQGSIKTLEMYFEKKRPGFLRDLIQAFPGRNRKSASAQLCNLNQRGTAPDKVFLKKFKFSSVIKINVP
jgi:hypothetical protein